MSHDNYFDSLKRCLHLGGTNRPIGPYYVASGMQTVLFRCSLKCISVQVIELFEQLESKWIAGICPARTAPFIPLHRPLPRLRPICRHVHRHRSPCPCGHQPRVLAYAIPASKPPPAHAPPVPPPARSPPAAYRRLRAKNVRRPAPMGPTAGRMPKGGNNDKQVDRATCRAFRGQNVKHKPSQPTRCNYRPPSWEKSPKMYGLHSRPRCLRRQFCHQGYGFDIASMPPPSFWPSRNAPGGPCEEADHTFQAILPTWNSKSHTIT